MLEQCGCSELRERVRLLEKALEQERKKTAGALRSAEKIRFFYDAMFENMNDGVAVYEAVDNGTDFVFTAFNKSAEKLEHISRTEVIGRRVTEAFPGVEAFGLLDVFRRVLHTGLPEYFPLRDYRDERLHVWRTNYVFRLPGGEVVAIYRDETERVRAEQAVQESERKFRLLFEEAPVGYQSLDEKGNFREVNRAWLNVLGYTRDEVIGRNFGDFLVPEWQDHFRENFPRFKALGEILGVEFEMVKKDGSRILVAFNGKIGKKPDGTFRQTHCVLHNITEQRQAEEKIIRSEREKEAILNGLRDVAVGYINRDMYFMWGNEALYNIIRCSPEEIGRKTCYKMIYGRTSPCEDCPVIQAFETGEYQEREKQGQENRFYLMRSNPVRNLDDEIVGVVHASMDITERRNAEDSLKWELTVNRALASLSEALLSSSWSIDKIARLVLHHALKLTGSRNGYTSFTDSAGANILSASQGEVCPSEKRAFHPDANGKYAALWGHSLNTLEPFYTNSPQDHPASAGTPPGHTIIERLLSVPVKLDGKIAGQILLANPPHDYTDRALHAVEQIGELYALALQRKHFNEDRKKLQKQLQQSQKMEAIGALAGGIAHDFNNLLFPIIGYTEMLLETASDETSTIQPLEEILGAARRAKELVWQILTFSRQAEQERRPVQVQTLLKEVLQLIRASLPSTIRIETRIENDCGPVLADPSQLHSIAMNLFTNAFHAMQETGGKLGVTLREVRLEAPDLKGFIIKPGSYVCLSVSDTGHGMTRIVLDRIFDPYFTTKSPDKGTGLGLAVVHGIVRNYGGDIRVYSEPGTGTVFHVYLPRLITPELHQEVKIRQPLLRGNERVMLVDDETQVLDVAAQMLEHLGYTVTRFTRPQAALEHFEKASGDFDLVMTDMTMPEMTGDLLIRRVMAIRPGIPVILCTGFSERIDRESAKAIGIREFLMKPVTLSELSQTVRHALDGKD